MARASVVCGTNDAATLDSDPCSIVWSGRLCSAGTPLAAGDIGREGEAWDWEGCPLLFESDGQAGLVLFKGAALPEFWCSPLAPPSHFSGNIKVSRETCRPSSLRSIPWVDLSPYLTTDGPPKVSPPAQAHGGSSGSIWRRSAETQRLSFNVLYRRLVSTTSPVDPDLPAMRIPKSWRTPRSVMGLFIFEFLVTVPALALYGIAAPNTFRTALWEDGAKNGFNSDPKMAQYAVANYRPMKTPMVWSQL